MAIANYQTPTKLTFFPSYLQYAYAAGLIRSVYTTTNLSEEDLYSLIQVDPSNIKTIQFNENTFDNFGYKLSAPLHWNLDFGMVLGHDFAKSSGFHISPFGFIGGEAGAVSDRDVLSTTSIVNWIPHSDLSYNGWSAFNLTELPESDSIGFQKANIVATAGEWNIGTVIFGKKWEAPQNTDISSNISFSYGYKQKKTLGGKVISQMNWEKPNKWLLDAWELSDEVTDTRTIPTESRNGLRSWSVSWSFLQDKYAIPQNSMQNSNNWTRDTDSEYSIGADGTSLYNSHDGIDFYTNVIRTTMGGHLPCVVRISESNNSDQWAIVRISKLSISQKNPKFIDIKLTLEEQI